MSRAEETEARVNTAQFTDTQLCAGTMPLPHSKTPLLDKLSLSVKTKIAWTTSTFEVNVSI